LIRNLFSLWHFLWPIRRNKPSNSIPNGHLSDTLRCGDQPRWLPLPRKVPN